MTGKHYNWHRRWQVGDLPGLIQHDSGLRVMFAREAETHSTPDVGTLCWGSDGARWIGSLDGGDDALNAWLQAQAKLGLRDATSISTRLSRLMREAGEWYARNVLT